MKHLLADAASALYRLVMTPLYCVVRRALRDELDDQDGDDPNEPWLAEGDEHVEAWVDCRMMRP